MNFNANQVFVNMPLVDVMVHVFQAIGKMMVKKIALMDLMKTRSVSNKYKVHYSK